MGALGSKCFFKVLSLHDLSFKNFFLDCAHYYKTYHILSVVIHRVFQR